MRVLKSCRITFFAAAMIVAGSPVLADDGKIAAEVMEKARAGGAVLVLIGLAVPWQQEETLSPQAVSAQREAIHAAQRSVLGELHGTQHKVIRRYDEVPGLALQIGADAIAVLEKSATVTNVLADRPAVASVDPYQLEAPLKQPAATQRPPGNVPMELFTRAQSDGTVLVLVGLKAPWRPEGIQTEELVTAQRSAIAASQDYLLLELHDTRYKITRRFKRIPGIALEVGLDALRVLDRSAAVTNVLQDRPPKPNN